MKRRITAFVTVVYVLVLSLHIGTAFIYASETDNTYDSAKGILIGLGLLDPEMEERAINTEMNRKDFVILLMKCIGIDETMVDSGQQYFYDVKSTDNGAGYIAYAYKMGITQGVEKGIFGASMPVTIEQATVMCMRALNYDLLVDGRPAEVADYLTIARRMDLYSDIEVNIGSNLNYRDAFVLLYNCMTTDFLVSYRTENGETSFFRQEEYSALKGYFGMKVIEGVIDNTPYGAQSAREYTEQGTVSIDGQLFQTGKTDAVQCMGYKVKAYYREDNTGKELIWLDKSETSVVKMLLKDVVKYQPLSFTYTNDFGKEKAYPIASDALTLYNGQVYSVTGEVAMPENGYVELIENNGDSSYDVVKIVDYTIVIAGGFNDSTKYLSDARDNTRNKDLSQFDYYRVSDLEGNECSLSEVPDGVVLQIAYNGDKRFADILVVENTVSFTVALTKSAPADCYTLMVEDELGSIYHVSKSYDSIKGNIAIVAGKSYTFLLDVNGDIVASTGLINTMHYGYLKQYVCDSGAFGNKCLVRMFTQDGVFEDLELANKLRIHDGTSDTVYGSQEAKMVLELITTPSIVRYSLDSNGMINTLEFPGTITNKSGFRKTGEIASTVTSTGFRYRSDSKSFGGKVLINDNTLIFAIPSDPNEEDDYFCLDNTGLLNSTLYPGVTGYTSSAISPISEAITLSSDNLQSQGRVYMFFDHLEKTYDTATQETGMNIVGYVGTVLKTYQLDDTVEDETEFTFNYPVTREDGTIERADISYQKGDYLRLQFDQDGKVRVSKILRYYSEALQCLPYERSVNEIEKYPGTGMNSNIRYDAGQIINIIDGYLQIKNKRDTTALEATDEYYMISNTANYFILDKEKDTLSLGSVKDLVADGSRVFLYTGYGVLKTVLIINE